MSAPSSSAASALPWNPARRLSGALAALAAPDRLVMLDPPNIRPGFITRRGRAFAPGWSGCLARGADIVKISDEDLELLMGEGRAFAERAWKLPRKRALRWSLVTRGGRRGVTAHGAGDQLRLGPWRKKGSRWSIPWARATRSTRVFWPGWRMRARWTKASVRAGLLARGGWRRPSPSACAPPPVHRGAARAPTRRAEYEAGMRAADPARA